MPKRLLGLTLALALLAAAFWWATRPGGEPTARLQLGNNADITGFARAFEPRAFQFPLDHGPHLDYQTEWWYYTGNLEAEDGRRIGYQLTFFRRGITPTAPPRRSNFASHQIYFAHFAISDVAGDRHTFAERFSRGAAGLAGASGEPYTVWLEDWRAESLNADGSAVRLLAHEGDLALDLTLRATKPIVAHGDRGLSPKSDTPGNASYYLSYTRMATEGTIVVDGQSPVLVRGESWFDHEWSTSALGVGIVGWDWFSLRLDDGRDLMFYLFRRADGIVEPASGGTLVEADGTATRLAAVNVQIEILSRWRSPQTNGDYPAGWRLAIPSAQMELSVEPWIAEQEMRVSIVYWEGAVRVSGVSAGSAVTGNGYVELTGYAESLEGEF